jgi:hypothetical protein
MIPWLDMSKVAIFPTLDDDTRERRAVRQRAVVYADARKERGYALPRGGAHHEPLISGWYRPRHHLSGKVKGGGVV